MMFPNISDIFPDECLRSYGSRISAMNGQPMNALNKLLPALVDITGFTTAHLIHHHTHLGYQRFVNGDYFNSDISNHPDLLTNNRIYASASPYGFQQFCASCVQEDMDFHGVSYWRRSHQLPGVDHCSKHSMSLTAVKHKFPFLRQPLHEQITQEAIPKSELEEYFSSLQVRRFSILSDLALHARIPLSPAAITRVLVKKSNSLLGSERNVLTQFAIDSLPSGWLRRHFPLIYSKPNDARFSAADEVLRASRNAYSTKLYLLAMSLLWDDPDEAMNACLHEATVHTSGFHERGGEMALLDVLLGDSIHKSCIRHGVHVRDFEFVFQKFLEEIRPIATSYASQLASSLNDGDIIPAGRVVR